MQKDPGIGILEDFRIDFLEFWQQLPNKALFFGLLASWLLLFQFLGNSTFGYVDTPSLVMWMKNAYMPPIETSAGDDGHGALIPFIVLTVLWLKHRRLMGLQLCNWWPAMLIVVLALAVHILGYVVQQPRISIVGFFLGIYGFMGLAWGYPWLKETFFPYFLFAFCVPLGSLAEAITFPMRILVCQLVEFVAQAILAVDIVRKGTQLWDPSGRYQYEVAAACSGLRSVIMILVISIVYGFLVFKPFWKRAIVIAAAFPLAVIGNLVRMLFIVFAAEIGGQAWGTAVHDNGVASLVPYVPAILGLFGVGYLLGDRLQKPATSAATADPGLPIPSAADPEPQKEPAR